MIKGGTAYFYDGQTAKRHIVDIALSDDRQALLLTGDSLRAPVRWLLQDLRALSDRSQRDQLVLSQLAQTDDESPRDTARLVLLDADLIDIVIRTRPNLFKRDIRPGTGLKVLKYIGGAVASVLLILFVILPAMANTLAEIIPIEREIAFGKTVTRQMERFLGGESYGDLVCDDPEGQVALQNLLARLTQNSDLTYQINLSVFDHEMINAFAAPGGQVVLLRGLIDAAETPEEIAGVLAHEIAHVESRDPTRGALRATGSAGILSMVLGDFTGGAAIALIGEHMLSASYTREAEAAADRFALDMLASANVSAQGFARFFDSLKDMEGFELPAYLSTHPASADRQAAAQLFAKEQSDTTPIINAQDWQALQRICN
jgi:Zn-dependent protease with chaperone function